MSIKDVQTCRPHCMVGTPVSCTELCFASEAYRTAKTKNGHSKKCAYYYIDMHTEDSKDRRQKHYRPRPARILSADCTPNCGKKMLKAGNKTCWTGAIHLIVVDATVLKIHCLNWFLYHSGLHNF
mmetsp:Transcript_112760/g.199036  ORF Transcript_112760/g.199036 Transcript_112760/m.199036 type:complete len:125 (-) Transcript_112760:772-1146(-)